MLSAEEKRERELKRKALYREKNRERLRLERKEYYRNNKDKVSETMRRYYAKNSGKKRAYDKKYKELNREKILLYYQQNKSDFTRKHLEKLKNDPKYKICCMLRTRIKDVLRYNSKVGSAVRDMGCSAAELKVYLESKFADGMSWDNHGVNGWHIDHIRPLSSFDLTDRDQFLKAVHYSNLQPLWAKENLSKGANIWQ